MTHTHWYSHTVTHTSHTQLLHILICVRRFQWRRSGRAFCVQLFPWIFSWFSLDFPYTSPRPPLLLLPACAWHFSSLRQQCEWQQWTKPGNAHKLAQQTHTQHTHTHRTATTITKGSKNNNKNNNNYSGSRRIKHTNTNLYLSITKTLANYAKKRKKWRERKAERGKKLEQQSASSYATHIHYYRLSLSHSECSVDCEPDPKNRSRASSCGRLHMLCLSPTPFSSFSLPRLCVHFTWSERALSRSYCCSLRRELYEQLCSDVNSA